MSQHAFRVVVLISGAGSNLQALIDQQTNQQLPIEIVGVLSNRPNAGGLSIAQSAGIATAVVDHTTFGDRQDYDNQVAQAILTWQPDLVVLAGYMRIMSAGLVRQFEGKMINIHPSLLPKYPGLNTHKKALEAGDTEHGSSVHFVTEELDGGPVIAQIKTPINHDDTEQTLVERIKRLEHTLYPRVVKWLAEGEVTYREGKAWRNEQLIKEPQLIED
ncbi:phosphoribosylglycinamide formyltransferase [Pleionea litopenaei]|uniref:Phosphoribosylglycinamide formyltransferase n=1 Tax=Pleionea litopenaei TaxID=3070815 RepID=A0AA51X7W7_9GAMM|nr:phosphoribosylglycinamide formyltransferase [Pleionea sp. HL-JVS1]WMS87535.1 phosphoribosylglycinamide formyltransferase [Pleionea sp. HL-JVS1]